MNEPNDPRPDDKSPERDGNDLTWVDPIGGPFHYMTAVTEGRYAGEDFARAEEAYDRSPCGIHLYAERTIHCARCSRLAATLPDFLDDLALSRPTWFAQGSE